MSNQESVDTAQPKGLIDRFWWIGVSAFFLLFCLQPIACKVDPASTLERIPIGSRLSDLDGYLSSRAYEGSVVSEWTGDGKDVLSQLQTGGNQQSLRHLGAYQLWAATQGQRDSFTGSIKLFHQSKVIPDDWAPSFVIHLIYIKGVLKFKEWGQLPG